MTSDNPEREAIGDVLAARQLLRRARDRLVDAIDSLEILEGIEGRAKALFEVMRLYEKAAHQAVDAERRFEKYSDTIQPIGSSELDLESAKRDILERLSRLAAARGD